MDGNNKNESEMAHFLFENKKFAQLYKVFVEKYQYIRIDTKEIVRYN